MTVYPYFEKKSGTFFQIRIDKYIYTNPQFFSYQGVAKAKITRVDQIISPDWLAKTWYM